MVGRVDGDPLSLPRGLGEMGGKRKSGVVRPFPRDVEDEKAEEGEDRPAALLCDRFLVTVGCFGDARSGEEVDKTIGGGGLSVAASTGDNSGISMSGTPRFERTSRYVEADLPRVVDLDSESEDTGVGARLRGIPGPRGGKRSRLRSIGDVRGSLSSAEVATGLERGVEEAGGNTKLDCFAVCGSSVVGSGVVRFLEGLRLREGIFREGFANKSSEGISKVGSRKGSGGDGSP